MLLHTRDMMRDRLRDLGDLYPILIAANRNTVDWFLVSNVERASRGTA